MDRLSWNEMRARSAKFAHDWKDAKYERGETQTFYNEFFEIFNLKRRRVASFEEPVKKLGNKQGFIDLFWKGVLLVEQKSAGRDLTKAREQAFDYFPGIKESELPRYVLACDFQNFELLDLEEDEHHVFTLQELPKVIEKFGFILGVNKKTFRDQDPVNVKASRLMGRLHDELYSAKYQGHDLEQFLIRLLFCLFADDTGIFEPRDSFTDLIRNRSKEDGSDLGALLSHLFQILNEEEQHRSSTIDEDLAAFPFVNGDLFSSQLRMPAFNRSMRDLLLEACEFNWDAISPAIFGALFQHVSGGVKERRAHGEHYTTEKNILKVVEPLFLDDLRAELNQLTKRKDKKSLGKFQDKIAGLSFFDPACGCGNFLIIAYREIRQLEIDLILNLYTDQQVLDVSKLTKVDVDQFYGIEINEFPAKIAEVALWMMDHIMNNRLSLALGQSFARIPLKKSPHIKHADALDCDWNTVLPSKECDYVFGNPPFLGSKIQTPRQREQIKTLANLGGSGGTLDFVCGWYFKAGAYVKGYKGKIAFVSTNSITQGEQVAQLWPSLFNQYHLEIAFAHRTFVWGSDVSSVAHVHVVILGLVQSKVEPNEKRLYDYLDGKGEPVEISVKKLSPYLVDAGVLGDPHLVVHEASRPINGCQRMISGCQPIDNGNYVFDQDEMELFLLQEPNAKSLFRPYIGTTELVNDLPRFILYLGHSQPDKLSSMPLVKDRMKQVSEFRRKSDRVATKILADYPTKLNVDLVPASQFLAIPEASSERRDYVPMAYLAPPTIPSNLVKVIQDAELWQFGILTSRMHMAWMRNIGGRLESRYRYSIGIVYNTFPWPNLNPKDKTKLVKLSQDILDARANHSGSTLADLYDPVTMPPDLRKAHLNLDKAIDMLYRASGFSSDRDRVEHLLALYEAMVNPMMAMMQDRPKAHRRTKL